MDAAASKNNFLIAYPIGLPAKAGSCSVLGGSVPLGFNAGACCGNTGADDVSYIRELVGLLNEKMCLNSNAIYAGGFSNGAMMAHRLACEAADLFTGIAAIEGNTMFSKDFPDCKPSRPLSVLTMCGGLDTVCKFSYKSTVDKWRDLLQCRGDPVTSFSTATSSCLRFENCGGNSTLEYCTTENIAHCWPGEVEGLRIGVCVEPEATTNINATNFIVERFLAL
jgi:polyhydroxybutyrate depolymerase